MAIMITDELGGPFAYVGYANAGATLIAVLITGYVGKIVDKRGPVLVLVVAYFSYILFAIGFAMATSPEVALILWALGVLCRTNESRSTGFLGQRGFQFPRSLPGTRPSASTGVEH
jgi:MFS-type transporter involved in bile tolerance (Atg22 family)